MSADGVTKRHASHRQQVAAFLVRMYPRPWRDHYGDEVVDLLAAAPLTGVVVLDVVRGALDAHLNLCDLVRERSGKLARMRSAAAATLAAWVMFCFAAAIVARSVNEPGFDEAAYAHPLIAAARWLAIAGLAGALIAVGCATFPLAVATAGQAWRRRDRVALALFAAPLAGLAALIGYTAVLQQLPDQPVHSIANVVMTASWFVLGVTLAEVAGVGAAAALIRRTEFRPGLFRLAGWAAATAAAGMSIALLAGAAYGLEIWLQTPSLFFSSNGAFATPLPLTWAPSLLVAVAASATATKAALRAVRALRMAP